MELPQLRPECSNSSPVSSCYRCPSAAPTTNFMCSKCFREKAILKIFQPPLSFKSTDEKFFAGVSPSRGRGADPEITSKTPLTTSLSRHSPGTDPSRDVVWGGPEVTLGTPSATSVLGHPAMTSRKGPPPGGRRRGPRGHFRDPLRSGHHFRDPL